VEKLQQQLKWSGGFPGVHSLLLKGCTHPATYEPTVELLSRFTLLLELPVVDPTQSLAFPLNVMALLPYLLHHYEDANQLCVQSAENIAQVSLFFYRSFTFSLSGLFFVFFSRVKLRTST
jgi:Cell morphogenesis C-terminal